MVDIGKIIKRSWQILWDYKVLWIFGILLALTAGGGGGNGGNNSSSYDFDSGNNGNGFQDFDFGPVEPAMRDFGQWIEQSVVPLFEYPGQHIGTFIWIGVIIFLLMLIFGVITALVRYPSETAAIRMVDEYEQTGNKLGFKDGWKLGWSRRAFRLWLIDLIIGIPALLFALLFLGAGVMAFFNLQDGNAERVVAGMGVAMICVIPFILVFILLMIFLGLLRNLFVRAAAMEDAALGESFHRGWTLFKKNWKSVLVMWLVMIGIGIGYAVTGIIAFFLLIPVYIILAIPAAVVAAIPGAIVFGITSLFASSPWTWIIAALAALPFFFLIVFAPLTLIEGWYMIYGSNVWTLTYREFLAFEKTSALSVDGDMPVTSG